MQKIRTFSAWWSAAVAGAYAVASLPLRDWMVLHGVTAALSLILVFGLGVLAIRAAQQLMLAAVGRSVRIRRWILRGDFIEGTWVDVNFDSKKHQILAVSLVRIELADGEICIGGEVYSCSGTRMGNFRSTAARFSDAVLRYVYERSVVTTSREQETGRGEIRFTSVGTYPTSYHGAIHDPATRTEVSVIGTRLPRRPRPVAPESADAAEVVRAAIAEYIAAHPGYQVSDYSPLKKPTTTASS